MASFGQTKWHVFKVAHERHEQCVEEYGVEEPKEKQRASFLVALTGLDVLASTMSSTGREK